MLCFLDATLSRPGFFSAAKIDLPHNYIGEPRILCYFLTVVFDFECFGVVYQNKGKGTGRGKGEGSN